MRRAARVSRSAERAGLERDDGVDRHERRPRRTASRPDRRGRRPRARGRPASSASPASLRDAEAGLEIAVEGPFLDDGTLLKPIAVDTTVADGSDLLRTYKVKAGDTLVGIARKFDVSMMTLWWANDLKSKDDLHQGQVLVDPAGHRPRRHGRPPTDTLESIAAKYKVKSTRDPRRPTASTDPNLVVGQVLVVPAPRASRSRRPSRRSARPRPSLDPRRGGGGGSARPPGDYSGGRFVWPVVGGGNYISQYFHYGHYGARHRGRLRVACPVGGRRDRHLRRLEEQRRRLPGLDRPRVRAVHDVQPHVGGLRRSRPARRSRPGRRSDRPVRATPAGPHLHFEVWRGPVWDGGRRVNPLAYL